MPDDLKGGIKIYVSNQGQMIIPRSDQLFGSIYMNLPLPKKFEKGECLHQSYELRRTRWITLDERDLRCDTSKAVARTTECITQFLEKEIGCSMGLLGSHHKTKR